MTAISNPSARRIRRINLAAGALTALNVLLAIFWTFPIYWVLVTTLKPEQDIVRPALICGRIGCPLTPIPMCCSTTRSANGI